MAAYRCPHCEVSYPKVAVFDKCPECGISTRYVASLDPDISEEAGRAILQRKARHVEFERWYAAQERVIPELSALRFHGFRHSAKDARVACEMIRELDKRGIFVSELHVVLPLG